MIKKLTKPLAAGYIYRGFSNVDKLFFETLDIIYCAFGEVDEKGNFTNDTFFKNVKDYIIPRAKEAGCRVVLSIAPSSKWETVACNQSLISFFADNVLQAIKDYHFDGVDLDWEYPKVGQYTWFTDLVKVVNHRVKNANSDYLVTAAIAGGMWQVRYYDLLNSGAYLDYINVMTYSLTSNQGGYQNALFPRPFFHDEKWQVGMTLETCSIAESIEIFNKQYLIPYEKLIIGIPFYGARQVRFFDDSQKQWSKWRSPGAVFYNDIKSQYLNNPQYQYRFDDVAGVPYVINNEGTEFISFDDYRSTLNKCRYLASQNVAGVMFWEYGCDSTNDLLKAIKEGLRK